MPKNEVKTSQADVDVLIPCYQYGRFLRDCVMSVLDQGHSDIRVLIIDNASTDHSVEVAQQLAAEDRRVTVVARRRNLGLHASFNEGIDWASSKYFMVLCADDLLAPGVFADVTSIMEQHPDVGFAYGRAAYLFPEGLMSVLDSEPRDKPWRIVAGEDLLEQFCREGVNHVPGSGVMVRTVAQKLAGHYRPQLPHTTDFEMWMRLARLGSAARTDVYTVISRLHSFSRKTLAGGLYTCERPPAQPWLDEAAFESFFEHEGPSLPDAARLRRLAKRGLAERAYWAAVAHLCRRQPGASRDLFKFALSRRPSTAILPPVSYIFRRRSALERIIETACEMMRWQHAPAKPAQADG